MMFDYRDRIEPELLSTDKDVHIRLIELGVRHPILEVLKNAKNSDFHNFYTS
jgi:hypothetical protein